MIERTREDDDEIVARRLRRYDLPRLHVDGFTHRIGDEDGARQLFRERSATRIAHHCIDFDGDGSSWHERRTRRFVVDEPALDASGIEEECEARACWIPQLRFDLDKR